MTGESKAMSQALQAVRDRFLLDLDRRITEFEDLKSQMLSGPDPSGAARGIAMSAHKIRGVSATLGMAHLGRLAGQVEDLFSAAAAEGNPAAIWRRAEATYEDFLDEMERVQPDYSTS